MDGGTGAVADARALHEPVPLRAVRNIWLDIEGLTSFFGANQADPRFFRFDSAATSLNGFQSDFSLRERVTAAYAMGKVDLGRLSLVGGVRVERTDLDSSAFTIVNEGGRRNARPIGGEGAYTNVLPSIIGTLNLRRKCGRSRGVHGCDRAPRVHGPRAALGTRDRGESRHRHDRIALDRQSGPHGAPVEQRRPLDRVVLRPRGAVVGGRLPQEHFPRDRSGAHRTVHRRRVRGSALRSVRHRHHHQAEEASVQGVGVAFAGQFTFLPAPFDRLGVGGSVTLLGSAVDVARGGEVLRLPLLEQADRSTSLTAYYQRGRWDLSGTNKYNSNFWTDYGAARALDLDQGAFGRVDMRVQSELSPAVKLTFSGINLNDEPTSEFQGGDRRQNTEYEYTGRAFLLGVSARVGR